jgi:hypothetical protein
MASATNRLTARYGLYFYRSRALCTNLADRIGDRHNVIRIWTYLRVEQLLFDHRPPIWQSEFFRVNEAKIICVWFSKSRKFA